MYINQIHTITKNMISAGLVKIVFVFFLTFLLYFLVDVSFKRIGIGVEELVIGLLIANLGYSFYINSKLSNHIGWHSGLKNGKNLVEQ